MKKNTQALDFEKIEDESLKTKLLKLKGRYAHTDPNLNLEKLLHKLCDELLKPTTSSTVAAKVNSKTTVKVKIKRDPSKKLSIAQIYREVWQRDGHCCTNCKSSYALEVDHILPRAAGGVSNLENLRLLCRNCNQRAAIEYFGATKMEQFLNSK